VRLLNVLLAIVYPGLGLWVGLWLALGASLACEGGSCMPSGSWDETGEGWQWDLIAYGGLVSIVLVILAVALAYRSWRLGLTFGLVHLGLLAVLVPFAGRVPNWSYAFVATWFVLVAVAGAAFLLTRRAVNGRSGGAPGTPAGRYA
jgi:hypothetical protein